MAAGDGTFGVSTQCSDDFFIYDQTSMTISGPAAGLAPALLAGMLTLGNGDLAAGYPLLLVAICLTGLVQIVLAFVVRRRGRDVGPPEAAA